MLRNFHQTYGVFASEKKIDRIEDRLAGIEHVLASLSSKLGKLDIRKDSVESSSQSQSSRVGVSRSPGNGMTEAGAPAPFEGESSINSQSDYAREMLAQAIGSTPSIGQNAEIKTALAALSDLVSQQSRNTSSSNPLINRSLAEVDPSKLGRPPWDEVKNVLDKATRYPAMIFAVVIPFLTMSNLREIFEDAYQNTSTCSAARRVLAYGVMEILFNDFKNFPLVNMDVTNFGTYAVLCKRHMEVALSQLDIFMPANYENIMALVLGSAQAIEMCKPSLCWVMISSAAGLCQNLGYHRINTMVNDSPKERNTKVHIFWMIYMFDKTLSLRLGRSSIIQDWDISLPFILSDDDADVPEGTKMLAYWIKVARVQGQTYEKLFSPAAFLKTREERTRTAIELVDALTLAWYERGETNVIDFAGLGDNIKFVPLRTDARHNSPMDTELPSERKRFLRDQLGRPDATEYIQGSFERVQDIFFHSDVVMHYSTCALIQRAVSPDNMTFNQECLESSRAALAAHMRANKQFNKKGQEELWSGYVHWSILQAPFTPFIVIFCNAIQRADSSDLSSLTDFVTSLESCRTVSEGADKLYKMCHLFLQVARLYILAKTQDAAPQSQSVAQNNQPDYYTSTDSTQLDLNTMSQFDPYLSALGLMPNSSWPMGGYNTNVPTSDGMNAFSQGQMGSAMGPDPIGMGLGPPGSNHNSIQDWFSGSRYLMNLMEAGDDLQMPDLDM
ncbi:fungal-specific transcription factor domain-containing protein [Clathrospora elynae]|uniref:Fungal-specific transcription factor domain-containing protein n=1 Tax=Clathrospora elynae TaxID=706981 RepID=A0A6A5SYX6_9PLEO|nr:fungal-specific transcription factor domain-containing protein [Clathrospora elynae]